jgi:hypothetical protein
MVWAKTAVVAIKRLFRQGSAAGRSGVNRAVSGWVIVTPVVGPVRRGGKTSSGFLKNYFRSLGKTARNPDDFCGLG